MPVPGILAAHHASCRCIHSLGCNVVACRRSLNEAAMRPAVGSVFRIDDIVDLISPSDVIASSIPPFKIFSLILFL
jgi:hypothetical protein